eukprot:606281-Alexandrium_andersonii.AAC.1
MCSSIALRWPAAKAPALRIEAMGSARGRGGNAVPAPSKGSMRSPSKSPNATEPNGGAAPSGSVTSLQAMRS